MKEKIFKIENAEQQVGLLGAQDSFLLLLEEGIGVKLRAFGDEIKINGDDEPVDTTYDILRQLAHLIKSGVKINATDVVSAIKMAERGTLEYFQDLYSETLIRDAKGVQYGLKTLVNDNMCKQFGIMTLPLELAQPELVRPI